MLRLGLRVLNGKLIPKDLDDGVGVMLFAGVFLFSRWDLRQEEDMEMDEDDGIHGNSYSYRC